MARKPLSRTLAANHEAHGVGGLNIDGCRLGEQGGCRGTERVPRSVHAFGDGLNTPGKAPLVDGLGRWPANVCLDEEAAEALDAQSGHLAAGSRPARRAGIGYHEHGSGTTGEMQRMDSGGASRFFYVAKPDRSERDMGILLPSAPGGLVSDKSGQHITRRDGGAPGPSRNNHPTVKPVALMRWLCRLVCPPGGLVLDPFCGSGSTGVAAVGEGFRFVGLELDPRFVDISRARLSNTQPSLFEEAHP